MRNNTVMLCMSILLASFMLVGCGGGTKIAVPPPDDPDDPGGTGGTGGSGATTIKSGDGSYTGGGNYEALGIKIVGPSVKFPTKFTYMGGDIQITAIVTTTDKIDNVKAVITPPGGSAEDVPMTGPSTYKCAYTLKGNLKLSGPAAQYTIKVVATNQAGKYAETAVGKLDISPPSTLPPDDPL